ncbi:MAG: hypothetical protein IH589_11375 [Anaerolineales bacterium]|nr:hypothetical protein [Anaerolineales bacterium]
MSNLSSRFTISALKDQISSIWRIAAAGFVLSLGGAGFTVLVAELTGNPIWKLAKDPAYVMRFPSYIGMLSNWSVMLWTIAAAICLFGAVILKQNAVSSDTVVFIAVSGLLNLVLAVDDLFLLHDWVLPKMFDVPEMFFYLLYALTFLLYLSFFTFRILKYDYLLFGAGLILLALSRSLGRIAFFGQFMTTGDMLKYFGIVFWLAFFYRTVLQEINALIRQGRQP